MPAAVFDKICGGLNEGLIRRDGIAACECDGALRGIRNKSLLVRHKQMMLVGLNCEGCDGFRSVKIEYAFDVFRGSLEPFMQYDWSQQQHEDVESRHPPGG